MLNKDARLCAAVLGGTRERTRSQILRYMHETVCVCVCANQTQTRIRTNAHAHTKTTRCPQKTKHTVRSAARHANGVVVWSLLVGGVAAAAAVAARLSADHVYYLFLSRPFCRITAQHTTRPHVSARPRCTRHRRTLCVPVFQMQRVECVCVFFVVVLGWCTTACVRARARVDGWCLRWGGGGELRVFVLCAQHIETEP